MEAFATSIGKNNHAPDPSYTATQSRPQKDGVVAQQGLVVNRFVFGLLLSGVFNANTKKGVIESRTSWMARAPLEARKRRGWWGSSSASSNRGGSK